MVTLTEEIGIIKADINALKDEVTGTGDIVGLGSQIVGEVRPEHRSLIIRKNLLDGSTLFWDDDNQGTWDEDYWSGDEDLDGYTSKDWIQVINKNNIWEENFDLDTFIDSSSTGTWVEPSGLVGGYYSLDADEILLTELIAKKPNTTYTKVTVELDGTNSDLVTIEISGDGGTNYQTITEDIETTISIPDSDGIILRLTNNSGAGFPTPWGTWGGSSETVLITDIKVRYS